MSASLPKKRQSPVPPVFIVSFALRLRRFFLRAADAVVPSYLAIYDRFMGSAMTSLVRAAARHHIADLLADGPMDANELARRTGTSVDELDRTMRALVSINLFRRLRDGRYANNSVSKGLKTGAVGGTRGFAEFFGMEPVVSAWNNLHNRLQDGAAGFKDVNGQSVWDWMAADPAVVAAFAEGMSSMTEVVSPAIAAAYPFTEVKRVCDVGGGVGIVLAAILRRYPHLSAVLLDSETMLGEARAYLADWGVSDRVELVPGNFFESVPRGADTYIVKTVLHNWEDGEALNILRNCRAAMEPGHRLLVADFLVEPDAISTLVPFMDMAGMLIYGGRERSPEAMAQLFKEAGFRFDRVVPLPACQAIFVGVAY